MELTDQEGCTALSAEVGRAQRGLQDVVKSPMYSTGVGLVLFGLDQQQSARNSRFRIRDESIFGRVKQRMRDWFYAEFD